MLQQIDQKLSGKKTFITAIIIPLIEAIHQLGYIDTEVRNAALVLLGALATAFMRMGVNKISRQFPPIGSEIAPEDPTK